MTVEMKKYLSFGGGVNSVAMLLMLLDQGEKFEAIFVDHGTDYPETYEYLKMFQDWLENQGQTRITVLKPAVEGYENLYDYYFRWKMAPSMHKRICTDKFKVRVVQEYVDTPCFMLLGIDAGEKSSRMKISTNKGIENRWPLVEAGIDRPGCKEIIAAHGLPIPIKSGCFICPFQGPGQWRRLRMEHPELFCKAEKLEDRNMEYRLSQGKKALPINRRGGAAAVCCG